MISTEALFEEVQKLATCQANAIKKTGVGKTRSGKRPIRVAKLVKKAGFVDTPVGNLVMKGKGALDHIGAPASAGLGVAATVGSLLAYNRLKKEFQGWRLGRQHTLRQD